MAVMENAENSFTLSYKQRTDVCLVRLGSPEEPIPRLRYMNYSEFLRARGQTSNANRRGKDFFLDDNGQIMIEQSSGNNKFLRNLSRSFGYSLLGTKKLFCGRHSIRLYCLLSFVDG